MSWNIPAALRGLTANRSIAAHDILLLSDNFGLFAMCVTAAAAHINVKDIDKRELLCGRLWLDNKGSMLPPTSRSGSQIHRS